MIPKVKRLVDPAAYAAARKDYCELCYSRAYGGPHHVITRGAGGPDLPENLIQFCTKCHRMAHDGNIPRSLQFAIVARREGVEVEELVETINRIRRGE